MTNGKEFDIRPRRSVLFVPADNPRAMAKVQSLNADAVIFDLEDAVAPEAKDHAREALREAFATGDFGTRETIIRINALDTPSGHEDLLAARACCPDAILLPKVETPDDIAVPGAALEQMDAPASLRFWAMMETPLAIIRAAEIAASATTQNPRLACLVAGTNDLARSTGMSSAGPRTAMTHCLVAIVLAAKAYGLDALDGVYQDTADDAGLQAECEAGKAIGFTGKTLIHPAQIETANAVFGFSETQLAEARAIVAAFDKPENQGRGTIKLDGKMVELLHRDQAREMIAGAEWFKAKS